MKSNPPRYCRNHARKYKLSYRFLLPCCFYMVRIVSLEGFKLMVK